MIEAAFTAQVTARTSVKLSRNMEVNGTDYRLLLEETPIFARDPNYVVYEIQIATYFYIPFSKFKKKIRFAFFSLTAKYFVKVKQDNKFFHIWL